jgi:hypothetical protein
VVSCRIAPERSQYGCADGCDHLGSGPDGAAPWTFRSVGRWDVDARTGEMGRVVLASCRCSNVVGGYAERASCCRRHPEWSHGTGPARMSAGPRWSGVWVARRSPSTPCGRPTRAVRRSCGSRSVMTAFPVPGGRLRAQNRSALHMLVRTCTGRQPPSPRVAKISGAPMSSGIILIRYLVKAQAVCRASRGAKRPHRCHRTRDRSLGLVGATGHPVSADLLAALTGA